MIAQQDHHLAYCKRILTGAARSFSQNMGFSIPAFNTLQTNLIRRKNGF